MAPERMLTIGDVAEIARVRPRTVRRWVDAGELRYVQPLGTRHAIRIDVRDLEAFLARWRSAP